MALPLFGDTPRPVITTRRVVGTNDLWLVDFHDRQTNRHIVSFQRVVRPERREPIVIFGVDTGLQSVEPAVLEHLDVEAELRDGEVWFDAAELAAAYGRDVFVSADDPPAPMRPQVVPLTPEERRLEHNLLEVLHASPEQIAISIQQLRNEEADGEPFLAALRQTGARRDLARRIRDRVRYQRSVRPYISPTSGPLVDLFPGLSTAQGGESVDLVDNVEQPMSVREHRRIAQELIQDIRSIDPAYESTSLEVTSLSVAERQTHIDTLRLERAALLWRTRQEIEPLQIELIRLVQRRVDVVYADTLLRFEAGELDDLPTAIGTDLDWNIRLELRATLTELGIPEDEIIGINRALRPRGVRELYPDVHIADIFIETTVDEKDETTDQIIDYFEEAYIAPTYVVIIRPGRVGPSSLITPRRRRSARE